MNMPAAPCWPHDPALASRFSASALFVLGGPAYAGQDEPHAELHVTTISKPYRWTQLDEKLRALRRPRS